MVDKPFARKRSGGPKTAAGKAIVAGNALSHGMNSRLVTLSSEDPAEFESLFQGLVADYCPIGTTETHIVHDVAHLMWKLRRLDTYEHQQMSLAALLEVKIAEIFKKMNFQPPSDSIYELFCLLDEFSEKDLEEAEELLSECEEFKRTSIPFMDPVGGPEYFPFLWLRAMPLEWRRDPSKITALGLNGDDPNPEIMKLIDGQVELVRRHTWAKAFLIKNREGIHQAEEVLRAEKMTLAWNPDRSHRLRTTIEGQMYRALKELRFHQSWRLERIAIVLPLGPVA